MGDTYQITRLEWHGISIEVRYCNNWSSAFKEAGGHTLAHLEVTSVEPERASLPITETGYRSHFTSADTINAAGGPVSFVRAALDDAAQDADWIRREAEARQMVLF